MSFVKDLLKKQNNLKISHKDLHDLYNSLNTLETISDLLLVENDTCKIYAHELKQSLDKIKKIIEIN